MILAFLILEFWDDYQTGPGPGHGSVRSWCPAKVRTRNGAFHVRTESPDTSTAINSQEIIICMQCFHSNCV